MDTALGNLDFSAVEETGLLTLYGKALESQSANPILKDPVAEEIVQQIDPILSAKRGAMARQLRNRATDPQLNVHLALRSKKYDDEVRAFLAEYPAGVVVNLGWYRIFRGLKMIRTAQFTVRYTLHAV
jgi:O-methyltransferase involved in polyketide biosynthesis